MRRVFFFLALAAASPLAALELWRHGEAAPKGAFFPGLSFTELSFTEGFLFPRFTLTADWMPPLPLPFSIGAFMAAPEPNLKSFGLRAAYHLNINDKKTDIYFLYIFDFGFIRNPVLSEYGDDEQELRFYDFRAGARRRFGKFVCLSFESGFKLQSLIFAISIKLN